MRVQIVSIAILISLMLWAASFFFLRSSYHEGQARGIMPNLHIKESIGLK